MSNIEDGGPAFPFTELNGDGTHYGQSQGMTLRDYFAAKALPQAYASSVAEMDRTGYPEDWRYGVALDAYSMADAMLRARNQPQDPSHDRA